MPPFPGLLGKLTIGALIIRIGFWGPLYYKYNEGTPKNSIFNYQGPYITGRANSPFPDTSKVDVVHMDGQIRSVFLGNVLESIHEEPEGPE